MTCKVYYNEFDKKKCAALKALMEEGHIRKGDIDDRPIQQVTGTDVRGYDRCHFFAGIGLWDYALDLARWEEGDRVWTGSCPCQPFSSAGRQKGKTDDRHLWPEWLRLIQECKPPAIFGEQVNAAITYGWLDDVYQGLEAEDYAVGSAVLPACSIGAPHRRERLWFVADYDSDRQREDREGISPERCNGVDRDYGLMDNSNSDGHRDSQRRIGDEKEGVQGKHRAKNSAHGVLKRASESSSVVGDTEHDGQYESTLFGFLGKSEDEGRMLQSERSDTSEIMGDTYSERSQGRGGLEQEQCPERREREERHPWETGVWIDCPDGKQRLVESGVPLLATGYPERVGIIHCAGDAIVPQVAAEFIKAYMEI